jgi:hypothetical protein
LRPIVPLLLTLGLLIWAPSSHAALSLRAAVEAAPALHGYDHYVELQTGQIYSGGLVIGPTWDEELSMFLNEELGYDVKIVGNGAVLDMGGQRLCISFCANRLDVEDCIVIDGSIRYRGDNTPDMDRTPEGIVSHCTFYRARDYAVRLQGAGDGVVCEWNLIVNTVDTGQDVLVWTGITGVNLPTGLAFGLSVQTGSFGHPDIHDNWTWFRDRTANDELLRHYCYL